MTDALRQGLRSFLHISPAQRQSIDVQEEYDRATQHFMHRLWYRGRATELNQFYTQLSDGTCPFWGSVPTEGLECRKIHTGLPRIMINLLVGIVCDDLSEISMQGQLQMRWDEIAQENGFDSLVRRAVRDVLILGDGAFKISLDASVSANPIIEWVAGDRIEIKSNRGRCEEICFLTPMSDKERHYILREHYGKGYVRYELYNRGKQVDLSALEQTANLHDVEFPGDFMLAVPFKINESQDDPMRGESIFSGKTGDFDALDETWSQWVHALRLCRPNRYIPERLVPRNPRNGSFVRPNPFDNQFIRIESTMSEGAADTIIMQQPTLASDAYLSTYITALDLALQGIISPSTLGIDVKKLDNAEAQREKEKTTLYTRARIIEALSSVLEKLCECTLWAQATAARAVLPDVQATVTFGEYANPSFEAVVEVMSNPNTPMSIEAKVEELWGDSRSDDWKVQEVRRIKAEQGIAEMTEPALGDEVGADV